LKSVNKKQIEISVITSVNFRLLSQCEICNLLGSYAPDIHPTGPIFQAQTVRDELLDPWPRRQSADPKVSN